MTDTQLDRIEAELELKLPADYRAVSREFPFRPIGNEEVYWFYDDPEKVINATRLPMYASDYDRANWKPTYLVIGHGAAGDEHLIDTALTHSPVYLISHEDLSIVEEWASLSAFVEYSNQEVEQAERAEAERERNRKVESQKTRRIAAILLIILLICLMLLPLLLIALPEQARTNKRHFAKLCRTRRLCYANSVITPTIKTNAGF